MIYVTYKNSRVLVHSDYANFKVIGKKVYRRLMGVHNLSDRQALQLYRQMIAQIQNAKQLADVTAILDNHVRPVQKEWRLADDKEIAQYQKMRSQLHASYLKLLDERIKVQTRNIAHHEKCIREAKKKVDAMSTRLEKEIMATAQ